MELAEALAVGDDVADPPALAVQVPSAPAHVDKASVTGTTVVRRREGVTVQVLAPEYRRIVELLQGEPGDGEELSAKELAARLGLELVPSQDRGSAVEGAAADRGTAHWISSMCGWSGDTGQTCSCRS